MQFFNVLEKKCYRYRASVAMIFSKTCRDRAATAPAVAARQRPHRHVQLWWLVLKR
jgi:hypothetical protein